MFPPIGLRGQLAISSPIWCPQPGTIVSDRWRKSETLYAQRKILKKSAEENVARDTKGAWDSAYENFAH